LALGLVSCDGAPSANPARSHAANEGGSGPSRSYDDGGAQQAAYGTAPREDSRPDGGGSYADRAAPKPDLDADAPRYHGKPIWAANRNHSSQDNADYQFKKNGADLGADSEDDFIAKAHAFVDHPPEGAETLKRANGDTLIYDAKDNLFAVVAKDGAPRTVFKPRDGAAYWTQQKADLDKPYGGYRSASRKSGGDDNG
jgi:pyocin large subunit-like protein